MLTDSQKPSEYEPNLINSIIWDSDYDTHSLNSINKITKTRENKTYGFWFSNEFGDGGSGFREDGRGVDAVEGDVGGDVEARHRFALRSLSATGKWLKKHKTLVIFICSVVFMSLK